MAVTLTIAVGSVLLVVCGFTWAARREQVAEVTRLLRLSIVSLDELAFGELCAVRAKVVGPQTMQDPVLGTSVVHFEARVLRRDRDHVLCARKAGDVVRLEDGSERSALVELLGAELAMPTVEVEHADEELSPRMRALLSAEGGEDRVEDGDAPDRQTGARYTLEHLAIRVGDELTLVGVPEIAERSLAEGGQACFTSKHPLFLTPESLEALQRRQCDDLSAMDRMLKLGLALGVACLLVGGVLAGALG